MIADNSRPVEIVLERLHGVRRSGRERKWYARCPSHEDQQASLSIKEAPDDLRALLFCHAGCSTADIVRAIDLTMADLFVRSSRSDLGVFKRPPRLRRHPVRRSVAEALNDRPDFPREWAIARVLATVPRDRCRLLVLRHWDYLTDELDLDLSFVLELACIIQGVALLRFGAARKEVDYAAAADRLFEEISDD